MKNVFEGEGDLREVDPLAAMVSCWRERSSGELRFERGASECGFDLDQGEVVGVLSNDPRFETAAILVRAGKLAADAVESLAPQGGDPALLALQTGLLTRREWKWGEKIRAIEVLSDVLSWEDGRYRFDSEARPTGGEFRLAVPRLLLELFLRSRDPNLIDHQIGPPDQRLVRGERFDAEFSSFGLTADAESVVHLIDGRSTAAEIAQRAPAEDFAVRKLLAALVTLGLVHPVPVAPARAFDRTDARETESPVPPEPFHAEPDLPEPDRDEPVVPEPRPEETMAIEIPSMEMSTEGEAPFETDLPETESPEAAVSSDRVELPDAEASPLDRFEPQHREPAPWEEPPAPAEPERWEGAPGFPGPIEAPEAAPAERRVGGSLAWVLGLLAAAVVGIVIWRARTPAPASAASAVRPTGVPAVTFPPPVTAARLETPRPAAAPTAAPAQAPQAVHSAPASRMAASRAATAAPAPHPTAAVSRAAEHAPDSRVEWVKRAERDRKKLENDRRAHYAVQLELVCEVESLSEAWKHDKNQSMWLLTTTHAGRDCFRVLWGRYPTLEAAKNGKSAIPGYFVTARNRPAVVSVP